MRVSFSVLLQITFIFNGFSSSAGVSKNCAEIKLSGDLTSGVKTVYPTGGSDKHSVEVYCDQVTDEGGWTVIQNRESLPVRENFERTWQEYVQGFGDLSGEFWIGLENIHAFTDSSPMELRIDLEDYEEEKRWAKYEIFHVGDAATKYVLTIDNYTGDAGDGMTPSSKSVNLNGMKFSTSDQDNDLKTSGSCAQIFGGGFWFNDCHRANLNGFVKKGISWVPFRRSSYSLKKVSMKIRPVPPTVHLTPVSIDMPSDAPSKQPSTSPKKFKNCAEIKVKSGSPSGVQTIFPNDKPVQVYCDQETDKGGWTVIQNRTPLPVRETFDRPWDDYVQGFGDPNGELWLGLDNIHALTSSTPMDLRVDLEDWEGVKRFALYRVFNVGDAASKYVLTIDQYSGNAGDSMNYQKDMKFSTPDQDNDIKPSGNCAKEFRSGFWFNDCHHASLNGFQHMEEHIINGGGINWLTFRGHEYSLKNVGMKIRPSNFMNQILEPKNSKNCQEIKLKGDLTSGIRTVYPYGNLNSRSVEVYCDQATDGGGWTVFQNRDYLPVRENFTRPWQEYVLGFGDKTGEHWLGLESIHALTTSTPMELRVDLEDWNGNKEWAKYGTFEVGDAESQFMLRIGNYTGNAGDGMTPQDTGNANGMKFSTYDKDTPGNCANTYRGGWWFNACHLAALNGLPYIAKHDSCCDGINWAASSRGWHYSFKKASMKVRPVSSGL